MVHIWVLLFAFANSLIDRDKLLILRIRVQEVPSMVFLMFFRISFSWTRNVCFCFINFKRAFCALSLSTVTNLSPVTNLRIRKFDRHLPSKIHRYTHEFPFKQK